MTTSHPVRFAARFIAVLSLAACLVTRAAEPPPPIDAFFGLPAVRQPRLSPDGSKIAFLFPLEGRMALGVFERATKQSRLVVRGADESLVSFFWKGNDRLVFLADFQGNESFFVGSTDLAGKKILRIVETQPGEYVAGSSGGLTDSLRADPDRIVVSGIFRARYGEVGGVSTTSDFVVAKVNIRNRGLSPLYTYHPEERTHRIAVDNAGVVRLRSRLTRDQQLVWEHRAADDKPWRELARHPFHGYAETWDPQYFAADNATLWLVSREEHDRGALYAYDTRTGERGPALFAPPAGEITGLVTSPDRAQLRGVTYASEREHHHWFDAARGALQEKLENTFAGADVTIASSSDDERVKLIFVTHDREPGVYFVCDETKGTLDPFKRVRDLDPARLAARKPVAYAARDGLTIHGYLTLPPGAEGRRGPLVIHPHGGPFGMRDDGGYDAEAQFLASRGYAVLQPNYRGSGGYGREFVNKGRRQWGRAMQDDLTDAVNWAVAEGFADPARVAIYGASYGGYAALAGVTLTPELYGCAVNYVGAADLEITFKERGEDAFRQAGDFSYREQWVGETAEWRAATSPVNFVERIRVPTLHVYGEKDPRVKIDHWERLEAQLKKFGKPYETLTEKNQGHGFRDEKATANFHARLEEFLARHLAPRPRAEVTIGETRVVPPKK